MTPSEQASKGANTTDVSAARKRISEILLTILTALADGGDVEAACRLAGEACTALRHIDPAIAGRFDALLHRLSRKVSW